MKKLGVLVALIAALCAFAAPPDGSKAQGGQTTLEIQANKMFNDTKLFVQAGDVVSFKAKGQWTVKPKEGVMCGPDGEPGTSAPAGFQLPGAPIGALVAVVSGKAYVVGSGAEITFEKSGPVLLTANTQGKLSAYPGNKGALTVQIEMRKGSAAGIDGRYEIAFNENQVMVATGSDKKVIRLADLQKQKVPTKAGEPVQLPADAAEKLRALPKRIDLTVEKVQVIIRDPQNPDKPPLKGLYDPNKKQFAIHMEGTLKQVVGSCYFTYAETIVGKFVSGGQAGNLDGSINLTLGLFCTGSEGQKGKGEAVIVSLPFVGKRVP
jgi:hypothetical protein